MELRIDTQGNHDSPIPWLKFTTNYHMTDSRPNLSPRAKTLVKHEIAWSVFNLATTHSTLIYVNSIIIGIF